MPRLRLLLPGSLFAAVRLSLSRAAAHQSLSPEFNAIPMKLSDRFNLRARPFHCWNTLSRQASDDFTKLSQIIAAFNGFFRLTH
jgi:hypothetical protein